IPTDIFDSQGRLTYRAAGLNLTGEENAEQVKFLTSQNEQRRRSLIVAGSIQPMREIILHEHSLSAELFDPLTRNSPFVPPGHAHIFSVGAFRFFCGDDLAAAHILVPQLENSLRYILNMAGFDTTRMVQDGTQEELTLHPLLTEYRDQLEKIIGTANIYQIDLLFDFRGGPSIRNELSHGKFSSHSFFDPDVVYACWLILHLLSLPLIPHLDEIEKMYS